MLASICLLDLGWRGIGNKGWYSFKIENRYRFEIRNRDNFSFGNKNGFEFLCSDVSYASLPAGMFEQ